MGVCWLQMISQRGHGHAGKQKKKGISAHGRTIAAAPRILQMQIWRLVAEVERMKDVNVKSKILPFMTAERAELILKAIQGRKAGAELLKSIGNYSNMDLNSKQIAGTIFCVMI